jgi:hypothetical protein
MPVTINGTNGLTFNNSSTQAYAAGLGTNSQTWQNVLGSRALSTTYTNSTGYPIVVCATTSSTGVQSIVGFVNGNQVNQFNANGFQSAGTQVACTNLIVPNGATYQVTSSSSLTQWWELR